MTILATKEKAFFKGIQVHGLILLMLLLMTPLGHQVQAADEENGFTPLRNRMVERQIQGRGITDSQVLKAMKVVPRHLFVPMVEGSP